MILTFRPIKTWPQGWHPDDTQRDPAPFTASYRTTLELIDKELNHLGANDVILQVAATERDCRLDGQLRSDAKVTHPGVILSFVTRLHGPLSYPCDRYGRNWGSKLDAWQHNLRAIGLGLEALRKVERYGIAERGQQYTGWREIGSGIQLGPAAMTREQAAKILCDATMATIGESWQDLLDNPAGAKALYKEAVKIHHPDVGGNEDLFKSITAARDLLLEGL